MLIVRTSCELCVLLPHSTMAAPLKLSDYVVGEKIGSGGYADVYKAHKRKSPSEYVAIKAVRRNTLSAGGTDSLITEIRLLKRLNHDHIVQLIDFQCDENYIYIIMEYCSGGDLSHFIKSRHRLPEVACQRFLQQIAAALKYIRDENVSHFDLKPQNILLLSRRNPIIKVADFGLAQHMPDSGSMSKVKGSPLYMAPEILLKHQYDAKVDLWSVGVILYECLFGNAPYSSATMDELINKIKTGNQIKIPIHSSISDNCRNLLISCLERDPVKRIDFEDFFNHPFVDLEHKPCKRTLDKAREILQKAVELDEKEEYEDALVLYTDSLLYLVPAIFVESNSIRRASLRRQANQYLNRTEKLKAILKNEGISVSPVDIPHFPQSTSEEQTSYGVTSLAVARRHYTTVQELLSLAGTTASMVGAIDIAQSGECYQREGSHAIALEKYELALGKLLHLLSSEPQSRRRSLLKTVIQHWMVQAELMKDIINSSQTEGTELTPVKTKSKSNSMFKYHGTRSLFATLAEDVSSATEIYVQPKGSLIYEADYERNCNIQ